VAGSAAAVLLPGVVGVAGVAGIGDVGFGVTVCLRTTGKGEVTFTFDFAVVAGIDLEGSVTTGDGSFGEI